MKPIKFKEQTCTFAKDQSEYGQLPAHMSDTEDGIVVTSCWSLSFKERFMLLITGKVWVKVLTFGNPLQPLDLTTVKKEAIKK